MAIACADSEILVTPVPQAAAIRRGEPMDLTIKIRNISTRSCRRDLGADAQELYLQRDGVKVYSSDACDARTGNSVRSLGADIEQAFQVRWDGTATSDGCANRQVPPAGKYQLFGRLGTKISEPVAVTLT